MIVKRYIDGEISEVPVTGYLTVDGERHLVVNIHNQPLEVLRKNNIYPFVDNGYPPSEEGSGWARSYEVTDGVLYAIYTKVTIELP